jgi:hypothetical protein
MDQLRELSRNAKSHQFVYRGNTSPSPEGTR